jgi:DNA modification methylase
MPGTERSNLSIAYRHVDALRPFERNARTHSKRQIHQIADSIKAFGFTNPVLINPDATIVAGHGRVLAAKQIGMSQVPTICLSELTPDQIRAYVIADNRLAEVAGWDESILKIELQHLLTLEGLLDVTVTGFDIPEIDFMIQGDESKSDPDDYIEDHFRGSPVSRRGDLWILRKHRLLCGSAIEESSYKVLMGSHRANAVFIDPPYNVPIDGHVTGKGAIRHREFAMAAGEMSKHEFTSFLESSLGLLARYSQTGSVHYVCMDWRHMGELMAAGDRAYSELLNLCIWSKDRGGMGSFYRSQHELVFVFKNGKGTHRNNVQLGKYGRNRTNVWQYPSVNTFSKQGDEGNLLALHPTVKPIALVADALLDSSARGQIVLDAFLGSGTTLMAAERVGRVCHGMELDPLYVDTAIRRWQRYTGDTAVHCETGETFNELEVKRA